MLATAYFEISVLYRHKRLDSDGPSATGRDTILSTMQSPKEEARGRLDRAGRVRLSLAGDDPRPPPGSHRPEGAGIARRSSFSCSPLDSPALLTDIPRTEPRRIRCPMD